MKITSIDRPKITNELVGLAAELDMLAALEDYNEYECDPLLEAKLNEDFDRIERELDALGVRIQSAKR